MTPSPQDSYVTHSLLSTVSVVGYRPPLQGHSSYQPKIPEHFVTSTAKPGQINSQSVYHSELAHVNTGGHRQIHNQPYA
jgi:hypothetical protein